MGQYIIMCAQVTTHGRLLVEEDKRRLGEGLGITDRKALKLLHLQEYDTEQQFCKDLE